MGDRGDGEKSADEEGGDFWDSRKDAKSERLRSRFWSTDEERALTSERVVFAPFHVRRFSDVVERGVEMRLEIAFSDSDMRP